MRLLSCLLCLSAPVLAQGPLITELCASNTNVLDDEDGDTSDWIELHNPGAAAVDLSGWYLSDDDGQLNLWMLPGGALLDPGAFLVVFASGKDRADAAAELHTNFKLGKEGEYLALVRPDGATVEHAYQPSFPPQYTNVSYGLTFAPDVTGAESFFPDPTPGVANGVGGPLLVDPLHAPGVPLPGQDVIVRVSAPQGLAAGGTISLHRRINFEAEDSVPMLDDGTFPDVVAGDGIHAALVPAHLYLEGDLVRWRMEAVDATGSTRLPPFQAPLKSAEYFGTGVIDPSGLNGLPLYAFWTDNVAASNTVGGTRASVLYDGEFYDNVFIRRRGGSSAGYPKLSYKFDFNPEQRLRYDDGPRHDELDLNTTWADKAFVRQPLSYELYQLAGVPSPDSFPVRVHRNGEFFSVAIFIEEPGEEAFLENHGRDPGGALYKMYNVLDQHKGGTVEKKTRLHEANADLKHLVAGLSTDDPAALEVFLFDNVDVNSVMNYLAATWVIHDNDHVAKNYFLYRDSDGTRYWEFVPWDKDLTWGRNYTLAGGVLNDTLWARLDPFSHPLFGDQAHPKNDGPWNRLIDRMYRVPRIREMYLARLRSFCDEHLGPLEGSGELAWPERRMGELYAAMERDVALDQQKWGIPSWGQPYDFRTDMLRLVDNYLRKRRFHLYVDHGPPGTGLIPPPNLVPPISIGVIEAEPPSGLQNREYFTLVNPGPAADLGGWRVEGAVEWVFPPGTMIGRQGELYFSPNPYKFRLRDTSPKGGEGHHVVGPYEDRLDPGETLRLYDRNGMLVDQRSF
ncbi:MAG: CotH kinase family protein [Planctomycetota bacterium]|nr:CotH kinase family protein [Planctomycetota bacterium]